MKFASFGLALAASCLLLAGGTAVAYEVERVCQKIPTSEGRDSCQEIVEEKFIDTRAAQFCEAIKPDLILSCVQRIKDRVYDDGSTERCAREKAPLACISKSGKPFKAGQPKVGSSPLDQCRARLSQAEDLIERMRGATKLDPATKKFLEEFIREADKSAHPSSQAK